MSETLAVAASIDWRGLLAVIAEMLDALEAIGRAELMHADSAQIQR